ncbi:hypothetical protein PP175_03995 [Aneurinibacillus sp. Ricciae_BoGa-3]|uniref:hypothetical protein n=1 Tax=Aneurinibacillus sp. Ricciae_BoGa-3 TaxID=3022697 RepID=UPI002340BEEE|nr:hypothetical protein [Aneurinibacillus sp. Ricciae_BoGa-3]WCK55157.1 hypothetical protein PP175_03995 [Aneurinibacillus sp. Ricciae_BoGa-3]
MIAKADPDLDRIRNAKGMPMSPISVKRITTRKFPIKQVSKFRQETGLETAEPL